MLRERLLNVGVASIEGSLWLILAVGIATTLGGERG